MKPKQIFAVTRYNFRRWHKNPRIVITFCLAFVLCFLLSDKAVKFAKEYDTTMQLVEAFVWTFGDSNSILLSSLLLLLLFADMPFISSATPFYLMRIDRKTWLIGAGGVYRLGNAYIPCVHTDLHLPGLYAAKLCWEYVERDRRNPRLLLNPGQRQRFWLRMGL